MPKTVDTVSLKAKSEISVNKLVWVIFIMSTLSILINIFKQIELPTLV